MKAVLASLPTLDEILLCRENLCEKSLKTDNVIQKQHQSITMQKKEHPRSPNKPMSVGQTLGVDTIMNLGL